MKFFGMVVVAVLPAFLILGFHFSSYADENPNSSFPLEISRYVSVASLNVETDAAGEASQELRDQQKPLLTELQVMFDQTLQGRGEFGTLMLVVTTPMEDTREGLKPNLERNFWVVLPVDLLSKPGEPSSWVVVEVDYWGAHPQRTYLFKLDYFRMTSNLDAALGTAITDALWQSGIKSNEPGKMLVSEITPWVFAVGGRLDAMAAVAPETDYREGFSVFSNRSAKEVGLDSFAPALDEALAVVSEGLEVSSERNSNDVARQITETRSFLLKGNTGNPFGPMLDFQRSWRLYNSITALRSSLEFSSPLDPDRTKNVRRGLKRMMEQFRAAKVFDVLSGRWLNFRYLMDLRGLAYEVAEAIPVHEGSFGGSVLTFHNQIKGVGGERLNVEATNANFSALGEFSPTLIIDETNPKGEAAALSRAHADIFESVVAVIGLAEESVAEQVMEKALLEATRAKVTPLAETYRSLMRPKDLPLLRAYEKGEFSLLRAMEAFRAGVRLPVGR